MKKEIAITCTGSDLVDIKDLNPFQGKFKTLSDENYLRLRSTLIAVGVTAAATVWKAKEKLWLLDGHQRREALGRLRMEGWLVPPVPINYATCRNDREAKAKVLTLASTYGEVDTEELGTFAAAAGYKLKDLTVNFNFPDVDLDKLLKDMEDITPRAGRGAKAPREVKKSKLVHKCPECGHEFSSAKR